MKYYPFKVWLSTILIAPVLHVLFIAFYQSGSWNIGELVQVYFFLWYVGGLLALPSLLLYYLFFKLLRLQPLSEWLGKSIMTAVGLALFLATKVSIDNLMHGDFYHPKNLAFYSSYCLCIAVAGFYFSYPTKAQPITLASQNGS